MKRLLLLFVLCILTYGLRGQETQMVSGTDFPNPKVSDVIKWFNMSTSQYMAEMNRFGWKDCKWNEGVYECWKKNRAGNLLIGKNPSYVHLSWAFFTGDGSCKMLFKDLYSELESEFVGTHPKTGASLFNFTYDGESYQMQVLLGADPGTNEYYLFKAK